LLINFIGLGFAQVIRNPLQIDDIDDESRISIWNAFYKLYQFDNSSNTWELYDAIWCDFLKKTIDERPSNPIIYLQAVKNDYLGATGGSVTGKFSSQYKWEWWKVYDFLEFISENDKNFERKGRFQDHCNIIMERERLGYRFIDNLIVRITSKEQITEIETAISHSTNEVQNHLEQSLILLSNRENPDFRNSIKESISAVEAQCKIICEEPTPTLTKSLEIIQRRGIVKIHSDLNEAFQKIYRWTNDDQGIRHALKDDPTVDLEDAQFMLIACSAFINYLQVKKMKSDSKNKNC
jgi:hypothetical protein